MAILINAVSAKSKTLNWAQLRAALLVLALIIVAALRIQIYQEGERKNARLNHSKAANVEWLERGFASNSNAPIGSDAWQLDFNQIEEVLWRGKVDSANNLKINSATLELLEQIHALLPTPLDQAELGRVSFLVEKSMPGKSGVQLAELINKTVLYIQEAQSDLNVFNNANLAQRRTLLEQRYSNTTQRQKRIFGVEVANKLFKQRNLTRVYLDQRMMVTMSDELSSEEKQTRLAALRKKYKLALSKTQ